MTRIRGQKVSESNWFGAACIDEGGQTRTRSLGSIRGEVIPAAEEEYSVRLGIVVGPITGDIALASLGTTQAERATLRADAQAARVDAALARLGIRQKQ
jgi:hypothetical protein